MNKNEEQMITGYMYPIDGGMGSSGGGQVQKLSMVCSHNRYCCERHAGYYITLWDSQTQSSIHHWSLRYSY